MGKFIELIDDDNQSVIINTDWIIYIEENSKDKVIPDFVNAPPKLKLVF